MKRALWKRSRPEFACGILFSLCFVIVMSGCNNSSSSPPPDTMPPTAPANLTVTAFSTTQINLSWSASTDNVGVSGYKVERCQGAACSNFTQIATPTTTTYSDTGLTPSTSYSYRIRATDAVGNLSLYSATSTTATMAVPDTTAPTAPTNLSVTAASGTQINLSWTASTDNVGVTAYKVEHCQGASCSNFAQIATPSGTSFNDAGLSPSTTYSYRVRATDAAGNLSAYSGTATATTLGTAPVSVSISPRRGGITTSQTLPFTATVNNDVGSAGVTWTKTGGTFTNQTATSVTFSATTAGPFTITATSNADNTKSVSTTIGVTDLAGVFTFQNDNQRTGQNLKEYALRPSTVSATSFGQRFTCSTTENGTVPGHIYVQQPTERQRCRRERGEVCGANGCQRQGLRGSRGLGDNLRASALASWLESSGISRRS